MQTLFEEYLKVLAECHKGYLESFDGLPPAALDWTPGPETNSISVLIFHVTGSERFWIGDVAMQESSNRDRDAEFKVRGMTVETLKKRLDDSLAYARSALERLSLEDMEKPRVAPNRRDKVTVAYALLHAVEHAGQHLGHIQLTSQLWKQAQTK